MTQAPFDVRDLLPVVRLARGLDRDTIQSDFVLGWVADYGQWDIVRCFQIPFEVEKYLWWNQHDRQVTVTHWLPLPAPPEHKEP